ncbi:MAG: hypothetical protein HY678_00020 [Chloroflexi bacterium]|nr:hypothetical protein [Chloroflexota bacterium]
MPARSARAAGLEIIRAEAVSEIPDGIRFLFEAKSDQPIDEVVVRFASGGQAATQYNYLKLQKGDVITGEYFHRTGQRDRYVPPGTEFTYFFEIVFQNGQSQSTEPRKLVAHDRRYRWEEFSKGPITVFYHGPVSKRAEFIADASLTTFRNMGAAIGADTESPLRVVMYNNDAEMIDAVSIRSLTSARQLVTEGQAFALHNLVVVQGGADRVAGVISHEVTHILVGRASQNAVGGVPSWLNEGLAEFGNLDPGLSYTRYLEWAVDTNRLVPILYLDAFPADPNLTIVAYGQARSIVEFMVKKWGAEKIAETIKAFNSGTPFGEAFRKTYGFDVQDLDRQWREFMGAKPYAPAAGTALPATPTATPEPTPAATATAAPAPAPSPTPQPTATATPAAGGGACGAGKSGTLEASFLALLTMPGALFVIRKARI